LHYGSQNTDFLGQKIGNQILVKNTPSLSAFSIAV